MSSGFLTNFLRAAYSITNAERGMAFDADMNILDRINVDDALLQKEEFSDTLESAVARAMGEDVAVITNNLIRSAEEAPNTNVHLHDLRMVVAIPIGDFGVAYLDQHIRNGVFEREVIDKLTALGRYVIENDQTDLDDEALIELFDEL